MPRGDAPLLIYDGDCAFCRYCVHYARAATDGTVAFQPYQAVAGDYPGISEAQFRAAVQLIQPELPPLAGAAATFRTLELGGHTRIPARLYRLLPPFAVVSEWGYRLVAKNRGAALRVSRWLFGEPLCPTTVTSTTWLFLRLLAVVYLAAFGSFTWQAAGLIGEQGILPAREFLAAVGGSYGFERYPLLPTLLWLDASTGSILAVGLAGCGLSLLLVVDRYTRLVLPCLYLLYLSLLHVAQRFMAYQWDILLLECGFLAMLLDWRPHLGIWLYRWLLFRFLLLSGLVKLWSGDPVWRDFSALKYHFETQPLPNVVAWYADQLPDWALRAGVACVFVVELVVPFLVLLPRRPRRLAAILIALFQLSIILSGSYNFFNLLTLCLCLLLLDDRYLERYLPQWLIRRANRQRRCHPAAGGIAYPAVACYLLLSALLLGASLHWFRPVGVAGRLVYWSSPWHIANSYGLFAVMTTERREILLEGSRDGRQWRSYELPYKPGDPGRAPGWATPLQPRLDWQLWFAAMQSPAENRWIQGLVAGLLKGEPPILRLFTRNPFPENPPRYLRASLYRYRFTTYEERRETGNWWHREYLGEYWPVTAWRLPLERDTAP